MKRLLALFLAAALVAGPAFAEGPEPVFTESYRQGFEVAQSTVSVSSHTVQTISAFEGWQKLELMGELGSSTSVHYRLDGTTTNIATVGQAFSAGTQFEIRTNKAVSLLLAPGVSAITLRILKWQKR